MPRDLGRRMGDHHAALKLSLVDSPARAASPPTRNPEPIGGLPGEAPLTPNCRR